ncbi:MAG: nucleotidyltransferase family protein [Candidatus Heimdallarchaeota archaeon]|nr:nucleotidyltransferase family protein [Candidatus Heimdallarchaeota archaeon]
MKNIQALLFSGGQGKRLFPIGDYYQKVMMPLGLSGRPVLEYIILHLRSFGITQFIALTNYRTNQIRRYFGDGSDYDVEIEYVLDNPKHHGTAGALYNAKESIYADDILIYFTDIISNFDVKAMHTFHRKHENLASLWIDPSWKVQEGMIQLKSGNTVMRINNNPKNILANTGISILKSQIYEEISFVDSNNSPIISDISTDLIPELVKVKQVKAYISHEWWIDVGNLSRHRNIKDEILNTKFSHLPKLLN